MPSPEIFSKASEKLPPEGFKIFWEGLWRLLEAWVSSKSFASERKREEMKRKDIPGRTRISTARLWISSPHLLGKG